MLIMMIRSIRYFRVNDFEITWKREKEMSNLPLAASR